MNKPTVLILGHKQHGKDFFCELLTKETKLPFYSSSFFVNEKVVFPVLGPKYNYPNAIACYEGRNNHRVECRDLILAYNTPDRTRMAREILSEVSVYCGMRSNDEFQACEKSNLFDFIFWVRSTGRIDSNGILIEENDESMDIEYNPKRMILIDNSGSKEELKHQVKIAAEIIKGETNLLCL
jgi:hypothetical protein